MATGIGALEAVLKSNQNRAMYGMTAGTWHRVVVAMEPNHRKVIGPALARVYSGLDPSSDHSTAIYLDLRKFNQTVQDAFTEALRKENIVVEAVEFEVDEMEEVAETAPTPKRSRKRTKKATGVVIPEGFGNTERGTWFPGYDAKWKSVLIKRVDADEDQAAADEMVSRGWWTQELADARMIRANEKANPPEPATTTDEDDDVELAEVDDDA